MKRIFVLLTSVYLLVSCGNDATTTTGSNDSLGDNPSAITDETQHPTGVTNQNVISTDTAAMNVEKMSDTTGQ